MKRTIRIGKGKGLGKGYKNIIPGHDKRVHTESGCGQKQPQLKLGAGGDAMPALRMGWKIAKNKDYEIERAKNPETGQWGFQVVDMSGHIPQVAMGEQNWFPHHYGAVQYRVQCEKNAQDLIKGGLADNKPDSAFDSTQLAKGAKVEREHTNDPAIAREIAKDHLTEDPAYYKKLAKMEAQPFLQTGHSAFYKNYAEAKERAEIEGAHIQKTKHTLRGDGWLVYK